MAVASGSCRREKKTKQTKLCSFSSHFSFRLESINPHSSCSGFLESRKDSWMWKSLLFSLLKTALGLFFCFFCSSSQSTRLSQLGDPHSQSGETRQQRRFLSRSRSPGCILIPSTPRENQAAVKAGDIPEWQGTPEKYKHTHTQLTEDAAVSHDAICHFCRFPEASGVLVVEGGGGWITKLQTVTVELQIVADVSLVLEKFLHCPPPKSSRSTFMSAHWAVMERRQKAVQSSRRKPNRIHLLRLLCFCFFSCFSAWRVVQRSCKKFCDIQSRINIFKDLI